MVVFQIGTKISFFLLSIFVAVSSTGVLLYSEFNVNNGGGGGNNWFCQNRDFKQMFSPMNSYWYNFFSLDRCFLHYDGSYQKFSMSGNTISVEKNCNDDVCSDCAPPDIFQNGDCKQLSGTAVGVFEHQENMPIPYDDEILLLYCESGDPECTDPIGGAIGSYGMMDLCFHDPSNSNYRIFVTCISQTELKIVHFNISMCSIAAMDMADRVTYISTNEVFKTDIITTDQYFDKHTEWFKFSCPSTPYDTADKKICSGFPEGYPGSCYNHGTCIDHDVCLCDEGWHEPGCMWTACNNTKYDQPGVCGDVGECTIEIGNFCNCDDFDQHVADIQEGSCVEKSKVNFTTDYSKYLFKFTRYANILPFGGVYNKENEQFSVFFKAGECVRSSGFLGKVFITTEEKFILGLECKEDCTECEIYTEVTFDENDEEILNITIGELGFMNYPLFDTLSIVKKDLKEIIEEHVIVQQKDDLSMTTMIFSGNDCQNVIGYSQKTHFSILKYERIQYLKCFTDEDNVRKLPYYQFNKNSLLKFRVPPRLTLQNESTCQPEGSFYSSKILCNPLLNEHSCNNIYKENLFSCNGHGLCVSEDVCECDDNWDGKYCNITMCNGERSDAVDTCSENGICIDNNLCACDDGYMFDRDAITCVKEPEDIEEYPNKIYGHATKFFYDSECTKADYDIVWIKSGACISNKVIRNNFQFNVINGQIYFSYFAGDSCTPENFAFTFSQGSGISECVYNPKVEKYMQTKYNIHYNKDNIKKLQLASPGIVVTKFYASEQCNSSRIPDAITRLVDGRCYGGRVASCVPDLLHGNASNKIVKMLKFDTMKGCKRRFPTSFYRKEYWRSAIYEQNKCTDRYIEHFYSFLGNYGITDCDYMIQCKGNDATSYEVCSGRGTCLYNGKCSCSQSRYYGGVCENDIMDIVIPLSFVALGILIVVVIGIIGFVVVGSIAVVIFCSVKKKKNKVDISDTEMEEKTKEEESEIEK